MHLSESCVVFDAECVEVEEEEEEEEEEEVVVVSLL